MLLSQGRRGGYPLIPRSTESESRTLGPGAGAPIAEVLRERLFGPLSTLPSELLGPSSDLALWARVSLRSDGSLISMDRGGQPTVTAIFNPEDAKDEYNRGEPAEDRQHYLERFAEVLEHAGGYGHDEAVTAAEQILPDVLRFDFSKPATFPNGRVPTDHVIEARLAILSNGQIPSDGLKPHNDLLPEFPYLGPPHETALS